MNRPEFDAPGLGLDIARRTAEAAGGTLRLETSELGGAKVVLSLRRRDAARSGQ